MSIERQTNIRSGIYEAISVSYIVTATFNNKNKIIAARGRFTHPSDAHQQFYGTLQTLTDISLNKSFEVFVNQDSFSFSSVTAELQDLFDN